MLFVGPAMVSMFALAAMPSAGCKSARACKGFDSCTDGSGCPEVRCICDTQPAAYAPTCGHDGTCYTTVDCPELCMLAASTCKTPLTTCDLFVPTQCTCSSGTDHYAAVWDCSQGKQGDVAPSDCNRACNSGIIKNNGGAGGAMSGTTTASGLTTTAASTSGG